MTQFIDVLVTCPDRDAAEAIARACVGERLAACANIGGEVASIYRWKGAIEQAGEIPLFLKTRASMFEKLAARIRSLHPYEVPCIVAMELAHLDPAYVKWLEEETGD
jgi:periplasmic divalent cation tolerance protein